MEAVNVTVRMERQTRDDAAKLFSELGISTTRAISMFLKLPCPKERYRSVAHAMLESKVSVVALTT